MLVSTKAKRKALGNSNQNLQVKINETELDLQQRAARMLTNSSFDTPRNQLIENLG